MALTQLKTSGIADDAVTTDKLANAINTERTANTAKVSLTDNSVTLAKMAGGTDGQIITYDASGDPIAVGPGTDGQVLTSTGAGSPPAFETIPPSGKILQVVSTTKGDTASTNSGTYSAISGLTVAITPASSSNKILYSGHLYLGASGSEVVFRLTRTVGGSTTEIALPDGGVGDDEDGTFAHGGGSRYAGHSFQFLDTPNTTSAITYGIKWQTHSGTTYLNRTWDSGWFHGISTVTAIEVSA